jgi:hypothetical protein
MRQENDVDFGHNLRKVPSLGFVLNHREIDRKPGPWNIPT